jgi:hypothetical protein
MKGFTPSTADRWVNCPASVSLSQPFMGAYQQSEAAKEGEAAHWVAEQVARKLPVGNVAPNGVEVTDEMREGAEIYAALLPENAVLESVESCARIHPEMGKMRVDAAFVNLATRTLTIVDYKFGHTPVDPFENWQLLASVVGFDYEKGQNLELVIVQPRAFGEPAVKTWKLTVEEYDGKWLPILKEAALEVVSKEPKANTGKHCLYCPARHACKALAAATRSMVDYSLTGVNLDLTPEGAGIELALLEEAAERIKYRKAGIEAQVEGWLKNGKDVPNYTLQQSYSNLKWTAPTEKILAVAKMAGVDILKPQEPLTPTQAKKAGLAESIITKLAERQYLGDKLKRVDTNKLRKAFQQ